MGSERKRGRQAWMIASPPNWSLNDLALISELLPRPKPEETPAASAITESLARLLWIWLRRVAVQVASMNSGESSSLRRTPGDDPESVEEAKAVAPELSAAISVFYRMRRSPEVISSHHLVSACELVAAWALERGYRTTAVLFVEAAAALDPSSASLANRAGRVCRTCGFPPRAEVWYERAVGLARQSRSPREYISACLGWGNLLRDQRELARAIPKIKRAGAIARTAGMKSKAAEALHDVFTIEMLRENYPRAVAFARRALSLYPRHHARYPYMAADLAALLVRRGLYSEALEILLQVQKQLTSSWEQVQVWGLIGWAAAGVPSRPGLFAYAKDQVLRGVKPHSYPAPGALYALAEGARLLPEWDLALQLAERGRSAAREVDDEMTYAVATALKQQLELRRAGVSVPTDDDAAALVLRRVAREALIRLQRWRGSTWRPRRNAASTASGDSTPA